MFDIIVKLYLIVISNWLVVVLCIEYVFYVKYNCDIVKKNLLNRRKCVPLQKNSSNKLYHLKQ